MTMWKLISEGRPATRRGTLTRQNVFEVPASAELSDSDGEAGSQDEILYRSGVPGRDSVDISLGSSTVNSEENSRANSRTDLQDRV